MIKMSVFYPYAPDAKFDMDYYVAKHLPMVQRLCGPACKRVAADKGLGGATPGAPPRYVAMGHLYFDSLEAFQSSFMAHFTEIVADVPNFTNVAPDAQLSEVSK